MKRPDPARQPTPPARSAMGPVWLMAAALGISIIAGTLAIRFVRRLPNQQLAALSGKYQGALSAALTSGSAEVRDGFYLSQTSSLLTAALRPDAPLAETIEKVQTVAPRVTTSALPRLQLATLRLREMELRGTGIDEWWGVLGPYLTGLEKADFSHHEHELLAALSNEYAALGQDPGSATAIAVWHLPQSHGPMAEYLAPRMSALISQRRQAGDETGAATCRAVHFHWLRQWTLDPGFPGTRLLAADLLVRAIDESAAAQATPIQSPTSTHAVADSGAEATTIAANLRAWRAAYRKGASAAPSPLLMAYMEGPDPAPRSHASLTKATFVVLWLAAAAGVAAVAGLLLAWPILKAGGGLRALRTWIPALVVVATTFVVVQVYSAEAPSSVNEELRRNWSRLFYWPRFPFIAAGLVAIPLLLATWIGRSTHPRSSALARLGVMAAQSWIFLAFALAIASVMGTRALEQYEREVATAFAKGMIETVAGPEADELLGPLRAWHP